MSVTLKRSYITLEDIEEINELAIEHNDEAAPFDGAEVDVDWGRVSYSVNKNEDMLFYVARDKGKIVGYAFYFVYHNTVYRDKLMACNEVLFVHKDYRKGFFGYKFLKWLDCQLEEYGVDWIYQHTKAKKDFGKLYEKLGYNLIDYTYGREV